MRNNFVDMKQEIDDIKKINLERHKRLNVEDVPFEERDDLTEEERLACDFYYWAATKVRIKPKGGGPDVNFRLNYPQRQLIEELEKMRRAGEPIRLVLLKARQWGASTAVQVYIGWLQLVHAKGLNSLIIAHQRVATDEIKDMYDRMIRNYGRQDDEDPDDFKSEFTLKHVGGTGVNFRIPDRDCKIKLGTAEKPHAVRGGDYNLIHLSEVGLWRTTPGNSPEEIVRAATSGVLLKANTLIVLESTANGVGTYFHNEYLSAREGTSQFKALFVPWFHIKEYTLPIDDPDEFIRDLRERREDSVRTERSESGTYLWSLWLEGATLEGIKWYVEERKKYTDHASMASEYPSTDEEAFANSGERVFSTEGVERLRGGVRDDCLTGEIGADGKFYEECKGRLKVWRHPQRDAEGMTWQRRYMAVVDVGGRSDRADWSVVAVFDRGVCGKPPEVVAQWRGHVDFDLLAQIAARIAGWYCNALLVVESNTLEAHDSDRDVDGDSSPAVTDFLQRIYPNLYRRASEGGRRKKVGFHTNRHTKPMVIGTLVRAVREGEYVERDKDALTEYMQYERKPNGAYGACRGCHDDILMTRAIGLHLHWSELEPPRMVMRDDRPSPPPRNQAQSFGF